MKKLLADVQSAKSPQLRSSPKGSKPEASVVGVGMTVEVGVGVDVLTGGAVVGVGADGVAVETTDVGSGE